MIIYYLLFRHLMVTWLRGISLIVALRWRRVAVPVQ